VALRTNVDVVGSEENLPELDHMRVPQQAVVADLKSHVFGDFIAL
jgi:hypothetical protein